MGVLSTLSSSLALTEPLFDGIDLFALGFGAPWGGYWSVAGTHVIVLLLLLSGSKDLKKWVEKNSRLTPLGIS